MRKIVLASMTLSAAFACSNGGGNGDGGTDGGGDSPSDVANSGYTQTGTIIDFANKTGISGIQVSGAGTTVTTDMMGNYSLPVPKNTPYTMQVVAPASVGKAYVSLDEQEWTLLGNANRGKTSFVSAATQGLLESILSPSPDPTLAVLSVIVEATGTCASDAGGSDVTGATISVPGLSTDGGAGAVLIYFSGGLPSAGATSVTAGQLPSALIYNLPPTASFNAVTVTHPTCHMKAFPIPDPTEPNISYTGNVKLEPSAPTGSPEVIPNIRVFLD